MSNRGGDNMLAGRLIGPPDFFIFFALLSQNRTMAKIRNLLHTVPVRVGGRAVNYTAL